METFGKIQVCKRELEVIRFLQTGSNNFWEAYYSYTQRRKTFRNALTIVTWFNSTIKGLHSKELFLEMPFVYHSAKANFECFTLQDAQQEQRQELKKIL